MPTYDDIEPVAKIIDHDAFATGDHKAQSDARRKADEILVCLGRRQRKRHASETLDDFVDSMRRKLGANDHKDPDRSYNSLMMGLDEEVKELEAAILEGGDILGEAVDVANFAYLVALRTQNGDAGESATTAPPTPWTDRLELLARLSFVPRWSIVRLIQEQSVAEHTFNVCWLYLWICEEMGFEPTRRGLEVAMIHDMDEAETGDMPATAKTEPVYEDMSDLKLLLKYADKLEEWLLLCAERQLGNRCLEVVARSTRGRLARIETAMRRRWHGAVPAMLPEKLSRLALPPQ